MTFGSWLVAFSFGLWGLSQVPGMRGAQAVLRMSGGADIAEDDGCGLELC